MEIAVYVDEDGKLASLYQAGRALLHTRDSNGQWQKIREAPLQMAGEMSIPVIKEALKQWVGQLGDCKVLLSAEVRGVLYSILQEEMGFHTWKSGGNLQEQLDNVERMEEAMAIQQEQALQEEKARQADESCKKKRQHSQGERCDDAAVPEPEQIGEGHYQIDLEAVLERDKALNSRNVLIPFMEKTLFQKLVIFCDHVPRWFSAKLEELGLGAEFEDVEGGLKVTVSPKYATRKIVG